MKILKGAMTASIAVFLWGFIFWWSQLPYSALNQLDEADAVTREFRARFPRSGVYMFPKPNDYLPNLKEALETGPAMTVYVLSPEDTLPVWVMLLAGFGRILFTTLLLGWILKISLPALQPGYPSRVGFVMLIALAMVAYRDFADPIWWNYPWAWNRLKAFYDLVSWAIAGMILATFITQPSRRGAS